MLHFADAILPYTHITARSYEPLVTIITFFPLLLKGVITSLIE